MADPNKQSSATQRMSRLHAWSLGVTEPLIRMTPGTHFLEQRMWHIKPPAQAHLAKNLSDSAWSSGTVDSGLDPAWLYVGKGAQEIEMHFPSDLHVVTLIFISSWGQNCRVSNIFQLHIPKAGRNNGTMVAGSIAGQPRHRILSLGLEDRAQTFGAR